MLVAQELLPADLTRFGVGLLKGIVMGSGSVNSHVSILIREMGIPALICDSLREVRTGMTVLLDADGGTACFEPDDEATEDFRRLEESAAEKKKPVRQLPCKLCINVGDPRLTDDEVLKKCDGIGLFRTEYLYFFRSDLPGEEEQLSVYRTLLEKTDGKPVTVRTFDIGSDKAADALPLEEEENPALGWRGLRVYSLYPAAFKTQLRALLRAACYGNLRIMYPMVTSCREMQELRRILSQTAQELSEQGLAYRVPPQGAMIETPAAAILSDQLAKQADFFSVGTNDLTQYTLALDRQNGNLEAFSDPKHEAVMSLIATAAENAHKNGIGIGICGELASQPELIEKWIGMGIDSLSVSPSALGKFRASEGTDSP